MKTKFARVHTEPQMNKDRDSEQESIENSILEFANKVRTFVKKLRETTSNIEDVKRIITSSGAIGANYIQANNSSNKKDFINQIKLCQKKAEESRFWLGLLDTDWNPEHDQERKKLIHESTGVIHIFISMLHDAK